ncbi:YrvL family regulatory protein [Neobacillus rhizophilus]|uniref:Uncharacterized protein n=1 Tax=Neobacillus rhizophilus TaxID=2833579 RepID=A0A942U824_9BACI|nr:hypothetical protein [Neobacillus rhizophilus]MBU8916036.1 regulatory YrvL family protein [Bacillus sp. FJAT-29953]
MTWLALHTVDEYMNSITIPLKTEFVAALLLFFIEIPFDNRKNSNSTVYSSANECNCKKQWRTYENRRKRRPSYYRWI